MSKIKALERRVTHLERRIAHLADANGLRTLEETVGYEPPEEPQGSEPVEKVESYPLGMCRLVDVTLPSGERFGNGPVSVEDSLSEALGLLERCRVLMGHSPPLSDDVRAFLEGQGVPDHESAEWQEMTTGHKEVEV